MHPNASECVRMRPNESKHLQTCTKTSKNFQELPKTWNASKNTQKVRMRLGVSGRVGTRPDASDWIRTGPDGSRLLWKPSNDPQNIKHSKTSCKNRPQIKVYFSNLLRNLTKITSNGFPAARGDGFWASWDRLLGYFSVQMSPRQIKRRKLTWRTFAPGSKLELKIFTSPGKVVPNRKKRPPRQGLDKRFCLGEVKTLKIMTLPLFLHVF